MGIKTKFLRAISTPRQRCPKCWMTLPAGLKFCSDCGSPLDASARVPSADTIVEATPEALFEDVLEVPAPAAGRTVACPNCSQQCPEAARYCPSCGNALPAAGGAKGTALMGGFGLSLGTTRPRLAVLNADGTLRKAWPITDPLVLIGKTEGGVLIDDPWVSPKHARLQQQGSDWVLEDLATVNGVYRRISGEMGLEPGDYVRMGLQIFRVVTYQELFGTIPPPLPKQVPYLGSPASDTELYLVQLLETRRLGQMVALDPKRPRVVGRVEGDLSFPADEFLSSRHGQFEVREHRAFVVDLKSTNGTYVRIAGATPLKPGDVLCFGATLVRFELA